MYTTGWYNSFYTNSQKRGISLSSNGWRNYKLLRIRSWPWRMAFPSKHRPTSRPLAMENPWGNQLKNHGKSHEVDGWMDGWTDGWMDVYIYIHSIYIYIYILRMWFFFLLKKKFLMRVIEVIRVTLESRVQSEIGAVMCLILAKLTKTKTEVGDKVRIDKKNFQISKRV